MKKLFYRFPILTHIKNNVKKKKRRIFKFEASHYLREGIDSPLLYKTF